LRLRHRDYAQGVTDSTGRVVLQFTVPPVGYANSIRRINIAGGAIGGQVTFYLWSESPENLVEVGRPIDSNVAQEVVDIDVPQSAPLIAITDHAGDTRQITVSIDGWRVAA